MSAPSMNRPLPNDGEAERACLGSLLHDATRMHDVLRLLPGPSCFFFERHQILYSVLLEFHRGNRSFDGVLIRDHLIRTDRFEKLGGYDFMAGLVCAVPSASRVVEYAQLVADAHLRRQAILLAHRLAGTAFDLERPPQELLSEARRCVDTLADQIGSDYEIGVDELVHQVFADFESGPKFPPLTTALAALDEALIGLCPGELCVVGGLRSSGKSAMGVHIAQAVAFGQRQPTLFLALEPRNSAVMIRLLAMHACIDSRDIKFSRALTEPERVRMQAAREFFAGDKQFRLNETPGMNISQLVSAVRRDHARRGTRLVVIDQLSHITFDQTVRGERQDISIGNITRRLKSLAKELDLSIVLLAQLNREAEKDDRQPRMSDMRDSAVIEHDADQILLLHSPDPTGVYGEDDRPSRHTASPVKHYVRDILVAKNRDGQIAIGDDAIRVLWVPAWQQFRNFSGSAGYAVIRPPERSESPSRALPKSEAEQLKGSDAFWA